MNDTLVNQLIDTSMQVAQDVKGGDLINGVPNTLLTFVATLVYGLIHRAIEKHRLRKKGLLTDK